MVEAELDHNPDGKKMCLGTHRHTQKLSKCIIENIDESPIADDSTHSTPSSC